MTTVARSRQRIVAVARLLAPLTVLIVLALAPAAQAVTDRYVTKSGNAGSMSCSSADPCLTLQQAFTQATTGDTIHIGPGTWDESRATGNETFHLIGAGAGTADAFDNATQTRIRGGLRFESGGSARGIRFESSSNTALWLATLSGPQSYVIEDVVAVGQNTGVSAFGALQVGSSGAIEADIRRTSATMPSNSSSIPATKVIGSTLRAEDSSFRSESTTGIDAAISTITLTRSAVSGITGLGVDNSQATISRSRLSGRNTAIFISSGSTSSTATLTDSLLTVAPNPVPGPEAATVRSGNAGRTSTLNLRRSTVQAEAASVQAGVVLDLSAPGAVALNLESSVVRATDSDAATADPDITTTASAGSATSSASYSSFNDVTGAGTPVPGSGSNVTGDPLLAADGAPQAGSPLIDRGDPAAVESGSLDLAGAARVQDGDGDAQCTAILDIGAFERAAATCPQGPGPGPDPGPGPGPGLPGPDVTAPLFSATGMTNRVFAPKRPRSASSAAKAKRGTTFRWTLSEPAKTTIAIQKRVRRGKNVRWRSVGALTRKAAKAGPNKKAFSGYIRKRALKPGRYRARFQAVDAAKNTGRGPTLKFRVVRR
jgi:hypothetical protein